ncbi:MAG TPA: HAMP domain-containing sensor histidine kinase [Solirubrobacteraceae bacterium]|jgi:signal transduction histidine kinase
MRRRLARLGHAGPAPTIRLRLTVLYGLVFLLTGAVLLTIVYVLARHNLDSANIRSKLQKAGLVPPPAAPFFGRFSFSPGSPEANVAEAVRNQLRAQALHQLLIECLFALGVMTMISVGAGWLLAGRALAPLREITATARRVSVENLGERIGLAGPADELKELADTFDGMLGRLDAAFASQRHFVASASHELRTPLAIMRTEVDVALADPDARTGELRGMGEAVRETVDRCEQLIEGLLMLARSEAAAGAEEQVDLSALAADCITDLRARVHGGEVKVTTDLAPALTRGQGSLLERMVANLIDNGLRYNDPGGYLVVRTVTEGQNVRLEVRNGGPVIEAAELVTLTEPFRRLDRTRAGFGLGLSIVRSVCDAHGGALRLSAPADGGLEVTVTLPAEPAGATPNVVVARTVTALTKS